MTTFAPVNLTCPLCQTDFVSRSPEDWAVGEKDTDFCPRYMGPNPLPALVHSCPGCGFAGMTDDYEPIDDERQVEKLQRMLTSIEKQDEPDAVERYRRMALVAIYRNRPSLEIADSYLRASWCARSEGLDGEDHCRSKALRYFEMAVTAGEVPDDRRATIHYLIGELHRRQGSINKAREWFDRMDAPGADIPARDAWLIPWRDKQRAKLDDSSTTDAP